MKNKFNIGDIVYSHMIGPECKGKIVNITHNESGQEYLEIELLTPIKKFEGYSCNFSKLEN